MTGRGAAETGVGASLLRRCGRPRTGMAVRRETAPRAARVLAVAEEAPRGEEAVVERAMAGGTGGGGHIC